ncbi:hypothetical protein P7K49_024844 [Saguinus oedipus]|uniref:Uncharacterized protein n=1 Tax=Saguinus oedipus TaxID=9490 RepID=A0ABQ9UFK5_SAGOE|nr:hypothetical protein P7K49_024844 [Saguinus oedipus]
MLSRASPSLEKAPGNCKTQLSDPDATSHSAPRKAPSNTDKSSNLLIAWQIRSHERKALEVPSYGMYGYKNIFRQETDELKDLETAKTLSEKTGRTVIVHHQSGMSYKGLGKATEESTDGADSDCIEATGTAGDKTMMKFHKQASWVCKRDMVDAAKELHLWPTEVRNREKLWAMKPPRSKKEGCHGAKCSMYGVSPGRSKPWLCHSAATTLFSKIRAQHLAH